MHLTLKISLLTAALLFLSPSLWAQKVEGDVFTPIGKYLVKGDAESLSAWFDDNLELSLGSQPATTSRNQAQRVLKIFFESNTPQAFKLTHSAEKANMKYALGSLEAGGRNYSVVIFVSSKGEGYKIQQLRIESQL